MRLGITTVVKYAGLYDGLSVAINRQEPSQSNREIDFRFGYGKKHSQDIKKGVSEWRREVIGKLDTVSDIAV